MGMTYSEGNTYEAIQKWTIYARTSQDAAWQWYHVSNKDETEWVEAQNRSAGYQRFAISQNTK